jgi:hypothetical protein
MNNANDTIQQLKKRASLAKAAYAHRARGWLFVFIPVFTLQNAYFGWNFKPESRLEYYTDFLHVVPLLFCMGNLVAHNIALKFEGVLDGRP